MGQERTGRRVRCCRSGSSLRPPATASLQMLNHCRGAAALGYASLSVRIHGRESFVRPGRMSTPLRCVSRTRRRISGQTNLFFLYCGDLASARHAAVDCELRVALGVAVALRNRVDTLVVNVALAQKASVLWSHLLEEAVESQSRIQSADGSQRSLVDESPCRRGCSLPISHARAGGVGDGGIEPGPRFADRKRKPLEQGEEDVLHYAFRLLQMQALAVPSMPDESCRIAAVELLDVDCRRGVPSCPEESLDPSDSVSRL